MSERGEELLSRGEGEGERYRATLAPTNAYALSGLQRRKRATPEGGRKSRKMRRAMRSFSSAWTEVAPLTSEGREEGRENRRRTRGTVGIDAARWPRRHRRRRQERRQGGSERRERRWRDASRRRWNRRRRRGPPQVHEAKNAAPPRRTQRSPPRTTPR